MAGLETDLFRLICHIADLPSAKITAENLKNRFGSPAGEKLIAQNALISASHSQDIDVAVGDEDRSYALQRHNGSMAYFSPNSGWVPVRNEDLLVYKVDFGWLLRATMDALGFAANAQPQIVMDEKVWFLGSAWLNKRKVPVIFARTVVKQAVAESLCRFLQDKHAKDPALVLTSTMHIPAHFQLPGQNRFVKMEDALDLESWTVAFKTPFLAEKMGGSVDQPGFSQGYRNAFFNGVRYEFTSLQAEILEVMDKAGRAMHKTEIMAQTSSQQDDPKGVFRSGGKYHKAWDVVIKNDKKGNYWLEY